MQPVKVIGHLGVHARLTLPGAAVTVGDDPAQVPIVCVVPAVERSSRVSLTRILASFIKSTTNLVEDVVVGVAAPGQDWDLNMSQLLGAGPVLTEVSPARRYTGGARAGEHVAVVRETNLLGVTVN